MADPLPEAVRIFLLSPATLSGVRGRRILAGRSGAPFMRALERGEPVPLGDVYAFISSLYFRGKASYARAFGRPGVALPASWVITPAEGLLPVDEPVDLETLRRFAEQDIHPGNPVYLEALLESAERLEARLGPDSSAVLLGSIASDKYLDPLVGVFGPRLVVPEAFVGRGDMSRGGLLLRAVEADEELAYVRALATDRHGSRPPKLQPEGGG